MSNSNIYSLARRRFIAGCGSLAAASLLSPNVSGRKLDDSKIHFGYASITWNGNDAQAIEDIAALGFRGIQLRANILDAYGARPNALRDLLAAKRLEFVAMSSGGVSIATNTEADELAKHARNAKFVHDAGGHYLQVIDAARPKIGAPPPQAADFKRLGNLLTEIGKQASDAGVQLGYHNHMGALGQSPEEVARIMDACDPRFVKLELDIAHYVQGGGNPVEAIRRYKDRLLFLHIKDVESLAPTAERDALHSYRFVELGRGRVDLPATFAALKDTKFRGWAIVELDSVPDKTRTPKDCATISKRYIEDKLRLMI